MKFCSNLFFADEVHSAGDSAGLTVGLNLKDFFQPKLFYDFMIL